MLVERRWQTVGSPINTLTSPKILLMETFDELDLSRQLQYAVDELGFTKPTPIQAEAFQLIRSGKDMVGIAQTGTGKTLAYLLPILRDLTFSKQTNPRVLIMVPTRELVVQVVEQIELLTAYINLRTYGIYGGMNINVQRKEVSQGADILVATPGRLYDLVLDRAVALKSVRKLVIDEVDVMLDLGFRFQLSNIFELLQDRRQNIMFSATMTKDVDELIDDYFRTPAKISIAVSGTPLDNIAQQCYPVQNFYTKVNLLIHLLQDRDTYQKVLVFAPSKRNADRIFEAFSEVMGSETAVIHSNKTQNYRLRSIRQFDEGVNRILVSTDVMARGLDLDRITHVICFDTPKYPENYMHRIGRAGRAEQQGNSILLYTPKEQEDKQAIEALMEYQIPEMDFPEEVEISDQLIPEERPKDYELNMGSKREEEANPGFHEKKEKNKKVNLGGSYQREIKKKYKKPKTRGDKKANQKRKNNKR